MKRLLLVSGLVTVSGLVSGLAAAQEVGKVLASTPVMKRVTEPKSTCTNDADGRQNCRTKMVTEDRTVGYKVVYEYAGRQHTVQLPFLPGPTIELQVTPVALAPPAKSAAAPPPQPGYSAETRPLYSAEAPPQYSPPPQPVYSSRQQQVYSSEPPVVVERYVREPVYVDPPYYPRSYYYPGYYFDPLYPIVGLALGYTVGHYGHGWRGGHGYRGGHWRR